MRLRVRRLKAERRRSAPIQAAEEVQWQLAEDYAGMVDLARADQNGRAYREAATELQRVLGALGPREPDSGAEEGGSPGDHGLYALPPVGNS